MAVSLICSCKRPQDSALFADDEIGDLKASLLLDFALTEIGPSVYNLAIADAQTYLQDKVVDIENACWEEELTYWKPPRS